MQRFFCSYPQRLSSHLTFYQSELPHISQLTYFAPIIYPSILEPQRIYHRMVRNHPYNTENRDIYNWRHYLAYRIPALKHCQAPNVISSSDLDFVRMSSRRTKSPKRLRNASEGSIRENQTKMQKTKKESGDEVEEETNSKEKVTVHVQSKGVTQQDWPQTSQECQWRRAGKEFRSAKEVYQSNQQENRSRLRQRPPPPSTRTSEKFQWIRPGKESHSAKEVDLSYQEENRSRLRQRPPPPSIQTSQACKWARAGKESNSAKEVYHSYQDENRSRLQSTPPPPSTQSMRPPNPVAPGHFTFPDHRGQNWPSFIINVQGKRRSLSEGSQSFHTAAASSSSAASGQGKEQNEGPKRTYAKRLWYDIKRPLSPENKPIKNSAEGSKTAKPFEFTVLSYNILAQDLLESNMYLYRHCDEEVLPWEFRRRNILEEIRHSDADVICLQEVKCEHYIEFFVPKLEAMGYQGIYKKRTGNKHDGCATFHRTSRFTEVLHTRLEYQRQSGCLDRDNVAVIVILQPRDLPPSHKVCIANTHLLWNPRRGDVKLAQLGLLFAEIERMSHMDPTAAATNLYHPVILCGDFNSLPHCPLYKFVKNGHISYEGMSMLEVSGQQDGRSRTMESPLWPKNIGVTQRCRYVHRDSSTSDENSGKTKYSAEHILGIVNDDQTDVDEKDEQTLRQIDDQSGDLHHPFSFSSVYEHNHGNNEVTTNHSKTNCTVDYIFYTRGTPVNIKSSVDGPQKPVFSSNLSAVRRLSLFTDNEVRSMGGLPNAYWSSDHLSLQARFTLTPILR